MHLDGLNTPETMATVAVLVGGAVRLLKIEALRERIPKKALPWIAVVLGVGVSVVAAWQGGHLGSAREVLSAVLEGALSGGGAVAGNETVVNAMRKTGGGT